MRSGRAACVSVMLSLAGGSCSCCGFCVVSFNGVISDYSCVWGNMWSTVSWEMLLVLMWNWWLLMIVGYCRGFCGWKHQRSIELKLFWVTSEKLFLTGLTSLAGQLFLLWSASDRWAWHVCSNAERMMLLNSSWRLVEKRTGTSIADILFPLESERGGIGVLKLSDKMD